MNESGGGARAPAGDGAWAVAAGPGGLALGEGLALAAAEAAGPAVSFEKGPWRPPREVAPPDYRSAGTRLSQYSEEMARLILARLEAGESLAGICRSEGMPHRTTVRLWLNREPGFAERYRRMREAVWKGEVAHEQALYRERTAARAARRARGVGRRGGSALRFSQAAADEILARIAAGEGVARICRDAHLPCAATVYAWMKKRPDFARAHAEARAVQADVLFDEAREVALAATPATVAVARLQFDVIRWMAARLAPRKYGVKLELLADAAPDAAPEPEGLGAGEAALGPAGPNEERTYMAGKVRVTIRPYAWDEGHALGYAKARAEARAEIERLRAAAGMAGEMAGAVAPCPSSRP